MLSSRIRAEVQVPSHVMVPRGKKKVSIDVVALIHNDGDEHYVMGASDPAEIHGWQVLDDASREVARIQVARGKSKKAPGATSAYCSTLVPSRLTLREHETLAVEAAKLRDGRRYTVRHTHWGYTAEAAFVAVAEPERAKAVRAATKPAAAGTRKGAKKRPAPRVSGKAGGKAATRKTAKR